MGGYINMCVGGWIDVLGQSGREWREGCGAGWARVEGWMWGRMDKSGGMDAEGEDGWVDEWMDEFGCRWMSICMPTMSSKLH